MDIPTAVCQDIVTLLTDLPTILDSQGQQAFLQSAGLDKELLNQLTVGTSPTQFVEWLMAKCIQYGRLDDGRHALEAVLEAAKKYVGPDRRASCDTLIHDVETARKEAPNPPKQDTRTHASGEIPKASLIRLRSTSLSVSEGEAHKVFGVHKRDVMVGKNKKTKLRVWEPLHYIKNHFEDLGETVRDSATELMWQKSGSETFLTYKNVPVYIETLNHHRFTGYNDWRLPTVEELMSLLEPEKQSNGLYINPMFDDRQYCTWSADRWSGGWDVESSVIKSVLTGSPGSAWDVRFHYGNVSWDYLDYYNYVRAVRSYQ